MLNRIRQFKAQIRTHNLKGQWTYFLRWKRALREGASSVQDEQAWITFAAMDFLSANLGKQDKVFEYGGGGSTLFFSNRVAEIITVEHNTEWFSILESKMNEKGFTGWTGKLILPEPNNILDAPDPAIPEHYASDDALNKGKNFKAYASFIDQYPDAYFACVLVDGRARPSCIRHAISKIKPGGFLVLDNSDREYYLRHTGKLLEKNFSKRLGSFGPTPYLNEFTQTSIWQKN
ncbi:MAG TPA: hypothetical protein PLQ93_08615 [Bacteroidia bacterium]|nr:hypothetical protein [Bacteroidia bacterium]